MTLNNKKAFSLIEISLVIIIIAILIAGSLNGIEMVKKAKLATAQSLTEQSVVSQIKDLSAWYETSLQRSFIDSERDNGLKISTWKDINPNALIPNNATQTTSANQPTFFDNRFNDTIPGVYFDGNDFLNFIGTELVKSAYSVFIIEKRMSGGDLLSMIGGLTTAVNSNLILAYRNSNTITQAHYGNDIDFAVPDYSSPITRMHSFLFNSTYGKKYWINGGDLPDKADATQTASLTSYDNAWLGRYYNYYYFGDIAEIIMFKRSLSSEERKAVEAYLSKKYNIAIQ
jgi:prepilin-type N-terminal cleavage/methylation domain-containing protein